MKTTTTQSETHEIKFSPKLHRWMILESIIQERHSGDDYTSDGMFIDDGSEKDYNYKIGSKKHTLTQADITTYLRDVRIEKILN